MAWPPPRQRPDAPENLSLFVRRSERAGVLLEGCVSILGTQRSPGGYTVYKVVFKVNARSYAANRTAFSHMIVVQLLILPVNV